jgi:primosomal protein N' (replication factor Y)
MLKSFMAYYDIVFPINLAPLTYKCPEALEHIAKPGMVVSAPLKNKIIKGILLERKDLPPKGRIKYFTEICGESAVLSTGLLKLLRWISDYYLTSEGIVLMQSFPRELFQKTRMRKTKKDMSSCGTVDLIDISDDDISDITESISIRSYHTYLIHTPSLLFEYSLIPKFLHTNKSTLILLPEVSHANLVFNALKSLYEKKMCILHGEISKGKRSAYIEGIISGKYTVVIGTQSALFAPLKHISSIIVLNEHSSSYKREDGIRYNLRDVAVMRGFFEKTPVFLLSVTPSVDSYSNAIAGKYTLITPSYRPKRPRIKIIDMRFEKMIGPFFSRSVFHASRNRLKEGKRVIFLINRRGYTTLFLCQDCDHIESCSNCNIPLILHKNDKSLKCHYCGLSRNVPERCSKCGSYNLELLGAGTQKIQEVLSDVFGVKSIRFDSDTVKKKADIQDFLQIASSDSSKVIVGTKMITKRIGISENFSMAALLNADSYLNIPDFRANEKAFVEFNSLSELVDSFGEVFIQTRFPQNPLFRYIKTGDYESFVREELVIRKELNYPPHSRLLKIILSGNRAMPDKIIRHIHDSEEDIEVLGPTVEKGTRSADEIIVMLKSKDRQSLNRVMKSLLLKYAQLKDNIRIDRDPF